MRRFLIISFLTLSTVTTFGQFWNKPDAQYTFHWTAFFSGNYLGFKQLTIDSDTLIDGNLYTRYHDYSVSYLGGTNSFDSAYFDTTSVLTDMAFFEEDSVLYAHHLNSYNDQIDTLYDFGALPGESWTIPQFYLDGGSWSYNCDSLITVNVLDTGHIVYQGQELYYLKVNYSGSSADQMLETDTIFERLGSKQISFLSVHEFCTLNAPFADGGSPYNLTCYNDNEISFGQDCSVLNVYTSVEEIEKTAPTIYPNPAGQSVMVQTISNHIHLTDLSGRNLSSVTVKNGQVEIDVSVLANGIYFIRADSGNATKLIVKH
ncbi:MAG: T9SS type A sorting domain-containing protein [Flavobacteriales bacterium]|nr:T9SS type A sorting domain-containing protein [Flavobacteriales bacterium]